VRIPPPAMDPPVAIKERIMAKGNNSQGKDKKKAKTKGKKGTPAPAGKASGAAKAR
jgi:hypothetical protein